MTAAPATRRAVLAASGHGSEGSSMTWASRRARVRRPVERRLALGRRPEQLVDPVGAVAVAGVAVLDAVESDPPEHHLAEAPGAGVDERLERLAEELSGRAAAVVA